MTLARSPGPTNTIEQTFDDSQVDFVRVVQMNATVMNQRARVSQIPVGNNRTVGACLRTSRKQGKAWNCRHSAADADRFVVVHLCSSLGLSTSVAMIAFTGTCCSFAKSVVRIGQS